ncbi:hypothetical protein V8B97DRAFT_2042362 [Scleroderma yunnanense]
MFKKPLSDLKTSAPLRSSDRRKLRQRVIETYGVSAEIGDILVPEGLMSQKISTYTKERGVAYISPDGDPLWFSVGKGVDDFIPTVYTLWKKYDLLPYISSPAAVIPVLIGGADLMIPGVVQISSQTLVPTQLVAITQYNNISPTARGPPLAVGRLAADLNVVGACGKGKAVHVLHTWKDHLFDMGNKGDPPGIVESEVVGEGAEGEEELKTEIDPAGGQDLPDLAVEEVDSKDAGGADLEFRVESRTPAAPNIPGHSTLQISKEEVSDILRGAVLQAIQSTVKSLSASSFPVSAGTFYSSYILPFRPAFVRHTHSDTASGNDESSPTYPPIDIKHSSHKSLATFLKCLDKQGVLTVKDMKPEPLVISVFASHPDVISHQLYTSLRDVQLKEEKREKKAEEEKSKAKEMEVRELWKPHAHSGSERFFFEAGFDTSALYTHAELKAAVIKYITTRQLINVHDQSYVNVSQDDLLLETVAGKNESHESFEFLKREEVVRRLTEKMQSWYEIRAEGREPVLKKGQLKPICIVVVKMKQGRRSNTVVSGFEPFFIEGEMMAEELRRICAGSTSVSPMPGKNAGLKVLVQGKQIKATTEFLLSKGVPKNWIEATGPPETKQSRVVRKVAD